jgi:nucleoside 2-deoxyribosyltransferase
MHPDTDVTAELDKVEEEDLDSGDAYEVGYFGIKQVPSATITKKEYGDPWIINVPKNKVTYISVY